jgi:hypothetical protein
MDGRYDTAELWHAAGKLFDNIKLLGTYVTPITLFDKEFTNKFVNILYICW